MGWWIMGFAFNIRICNCQRLEVSLVQRISKIY
jgi:hypothetical protein